MNKKHRENTEVNIAFSSALNKVQDTETTLVEIRPPIAFRSRVKKIFRLIVRPIYRGVKPVFRPGVSRLRHYFTTEVIQTIQHITTAAIQESREARDNLREEIQQFTQMQTDSLKFKIESLQFKIESLQSKLVQIEQYSYSTARRIAVPCGEGELLVRTEAGYIICPITDPMLIACLIDSGELESGTRRVIQRFLNPGDTFVDVGAHIGMHTLAAGHSLKGQGKIIAFEPFAPTANLLKKSVWMNGFSNLVEIHQAAVSNVKSLEKLFLGEISGHHSLFPVSSSEGVIKQVEVPTVTLDEMLPLDQKINLIKIDAEGAELEVLAGGEGIIHKNSDIALIVEFGPSHLVRSNHTIKDWFNIFTNLGLQHKVINEQTSTLEDYSFEELENVQSVNLFFARKNSTAWEKAVV